MIGLAGASSDARRFVAAELDERGVAYRADGELDGVDLLINVDRQPAFESVAAAVAAGVGFVDACDDPAFAEEVYERFGTAPVLLVPGCAPEQVLGDLAAAIAAADLDRPAEVVVSYDFGGGVPRHATPRRWSRRRLARFPEITRTGVEVQWGERVRVPRWLPGVSVSTVIAVSDLAATFVQLNGALDPLTRYLPSLVATAPLQGRFRLIAEARAGARRSAVVVEAAGGPELAARVLVEAAIQAGGAGALTPAQALDPAPFLQSLNGRDLTWQRVDSRP